MPPLLALYPDGPAERGGVTVEMAGAEHEGVNGVIIQIFTLITGAAAANGFHGIAGQFDRQSLLRFSTPGGGSGLRVQRRDNGKSVAVELDMSTVPAPPNIRRLPVAALEPRATPQQRAAFAVAWQARVKCLLLERADEPAVIRVTTLN